MVTEDVLLAAPASASPATTAASAARLADLATSDWVVPHADLTCAEMVMRACGAAGFQPNVVAEATDHSVQLRLVAAGIGVALVPRLADQPAPGCGCCPSTRACSDITSRSCAAPRRATPGSAGSSS